MDEARAKWMALFELNGWTVGGKLTPKAQRADVGLSLIGEKNNFLALDWLIDLNEDFLVFEYENSAPPSIFPWKDTSGEAGVTTMWVPWTSIGYLYRNRRASH